MHESILFFIQRDKTAASTGGVSFAETSSLIVLFVGIVIAGCAGYYWYNAEFL